MLSENVIGIEKGDPAPAAAGRILYMEDDLGLARLMKKQLARHGFSVEIASDGEAGLSLIERESFDVVLVDYHMPGMSGIEVVRQIVKRDRPLPVVMVTGNGDEKVAVEALKLGATDYVVKDLDLSYLEILPMVIEKVLSGRKLALEREGALQSLRESEERYRRLVDLSPDGIVICCRSRIEFANPAALRLLGASVPEEVIGQMMLRFVDPDSVQDFKVQLEDIEGSKVKIPWVEERFVRLDRTKLSVEVSGIPFTLRGEPGVQIIFRDISERVKAKQLLEKLAYYDQLTGLPNRALFFDRLRMNLEQSKRDQSSFALIYLDLDGFKSVNDLLGHDKGDALLSQVAERLTGCCRSCDTVARIGGDEFVIVMSRVKAVADAAVVARKVVAAMSAEFDLGGERCTIGGSAGISMYPDDGEDADALLKKADVAMYQAKEQGGDKYLYYRELG